MHQYFYQTETATFGPMSFHELWTAARESKLKPNDSVRVDGSRDWVRAENMPELFAEQEPPTDIELIQRQVRAVQEERQRAAEEALRERNEALQKAGRPPETALPFALVQDYPGSEYTLLRPKTARPVPTFQPRQYPLIELGIMLLYILGTIVILFAFGGIIYSLNQTGNGGLPLFVTFFYIGLAGLFEFVLAAILAAYLDLLSDTKRAADALEQQGKSDER